MVQCEYFFFQIRRQLFRKNTSFIRLAGSQAAPYSYISEFHTSKTAARAVAHSNIFMNGVVEFLSLPAMLIIPMDWTWHIIGVHFKPWRLYLVCTSLINLWNGIVFIFLPESPKFLLSNNQEEKALQVLRRVYAFKTCQPPEVIYLLPILLTNVNREIIICSNFIGELPNCWYQIQC